MNMLIPKRHGWNVWSQTDLLIKKLQNENQNIQQKGKWPRQSIEDNKIDKQIWVQHNPLTLNKNKHVYFKT